MSDKIFEKLKEIIPEVQKNVGLNNYTTYKIGGPAKYFFIAKTEEDIILSVKTAKNFKLPFFILGGGSNLLVSDRGYKGIVIKLSNKHIEFTGNLLRAGAGVSLPSLSDFAVENGFSGFEWSAGVPGTIGGAILGHAQAFGQKISDDITSVRIFDSKTFKIKNFTKSQCNFNTKDSIFKRNKNFIIISADFLVRNGYKNKIKEQQNKFLRYRSDNHPIDMPSAGSVFINPEKSIKNKKLLLRFPELADFNAKGVIPSGYLIEKSGLMGKKVGGAQISNKHANFIVNTGGAKAKDVLSLIKTVQKKVKSAFGVLLKTEIRFLGF